MSKSWCCASVVLLAELVLGAPVRAEDLTPCPEHGEGVDFVRASRELEANKDLPGAEACLSRGLAAHPKDVDLLFAKVRVLAWQERLPEAKRLLQTVDRKTAPPGALAEVTGDLAWMGNEPRRAADAYLLALAAKDTAADAKPDLYVRLIKALMAADASDEAKAQLQAATTLFPNDTGIRDAGAALTQDSALRLRSELDTDRVFESQHQRMDELDETFAVGFKHLDADVNAHQITWQIPNVAAMTDRIYGADLSWRTDQGQLIAASYAHSIHPSFSYQDLYSIDLEQALDEGAYAGIGGELRRFPGATSVVTTLYGGLYRGDYHARLTGYLADGDGSVLLRAERVQGVWQPGLWLSGGRSESLRPYLVQNDMHQPYTAVGAKLTAAFTPVRITLYYEYESQRSSYWQQTLGANLEWQL